MAQLWTIIFIVLLAIACALAALNDHEETKKKERLAADYAKRSRVSERPEPPGSSESEPRAERLERHL